MYLDADEFPFTFDEMYAALRIICRYEADARESAEEYQRVAEDNRRERVEAARTNGSGAPDLWVLPLELLAALSLGSADAAVRVERLRLSRLPPEALALRAEEDAYWAELLDTVRGWAAERAGDDPEATT